MKNCLADTITYTSRMSQQKCSDCEVCAHDRQGSISQYVTIMFTKCATFDYSLRAK